MPPRATRPERVLMTADTVGGVWTYATELARELCGRGVEVLLATLGGPAPRAERLRLQEIPRLTLAESDYPLEWMQDPWDGVERSRRWLLDLARAFAPDVVHLNSFAHGDLGWPCPTLIVGHSCVTSWFRAVRGVDPPAEWERYRRCVTAGLSAADLVVAPTQAMLSALEEHYGPFVATRVIANGRRPSDFAPGTKERAVLSAGRLWDEAKNVVQLARAAAGLPWPVRVAGDAVHPDGGTVSFDNVTVLGRLEPPRLAEEMARAAVYALPARYEPFGLSALEAGLSGCALVLGDIPSLREVWGDAATFVPADDPAALRAALRALLDEPERCAIRAERARARALAYGAGRMAEAYLAAYHHLLRPEGAARPRARLRTGAEGR